jgi:hypothetical protein
MKWFAYLVLVLSVIALGLSLFFYADEGNLLSQKDIYASINVTDHFGFDLNDSALTFGKLPNGGSLTRHVSFHNDQEVPVILKIEKESSLEDIIFHENDIKVGKGETKRISFAAIVPDEKEHGFYEGNIRIFVFEDEKSI